MRSDAYQTPYYVWSVSAIATAVLHAGGIWWVQAHWQNQQAASPPAPIAVIAIPEAPAAIAPPLTAAANEPAIAPAPPTSAPPAVEANIPSSLPAPADIPAPSEPADPPVFSEPVTPAPSEPSSPPPADPEPSSQVVSNPADPMTSTPDPAPTEPPSETPKPSQQEDKTSTSPSSWRIIWQQEVDPQAADLPDSPPQFSPAWEQAVSGLLQDSDCFRSLAANVALTQITLQPVVEADSRISQIYVRQSRDFASEPLERCLTTLIPQMPLPVAAVTAGKSIVSDVVLLTLDISAVD